MNVLVPLLIGVFIGIVSGLVGIGGGAILTPILIYGYHMSQHKAQGTSLAMLLLPSGLLAFWKYYKAGAADLKLGLIVAVGVLLGGLIGGDWAQRIPDVRTAQGILHFPGGDRRKNVLRIVLIAFLLIVLLAFLPTPFRILLVSEH